MADDVLRLRATVVSDEALANIRKIGREIGAIPQQAGRGVAQLNSQFLTLSNTLKGLATGAAVRTLTDAATRVNELRYASVELRMGTTELRGWNLAAERVGISSQTMMQNMRQFGSIADGLRYDIGGVRSQLYALGAGPIVRSIMGTTDKAEQLRKVFQFKDTLLTEPNGIFKATEWMRIWGFGADSIRLTSEQAEAAIKRIVPLTKEAEEAARKFKEQVAELGEKWDDLTVKAGTLAFPGLAAGLALAGDAADALARLATEAERIKNLVPGGTTTGPGGPVSESMSDIGLGSLPGWLGWLAATIASGGGGVPLAILRGSRPSENPPSQQYGPFLPPVSPPVVPPPTTAPTSPSARDVERERLRRSRFGFKPISFNEGEMGQSTGESPKNVVKAGVFEALIDFQSYLAGGGPGGGIVRASLGGDGVDNSPVGRAFRAAGGPGGAGPGIPPGGPAPGTGALPGGPSAAPGGVPTAPGSGGGAPEAILAKAREVAATEGAGGLKKFMADQGYPQHDQWCGDFAAAVVKSTGGTPPKNPEVASNWRNFGTKVEGAPQPGDIAVAKPGWSRRGSGQTGQTGSHVTIVESGIDPKTGKFRGLGGNQGRRIAPFDASKFDFYRGGGGKSGPSGSPAAPGNRGAALYQKLLAEFKQNPPQGVPPDAARFGITKGTPEEWARFGVSVAHAESGFNPNRKNLGDPGGSFGIFQYAHRQVPGGNAYDVNASVAAFVRDANKASIDPRGLRGSSVLGKRFSTIGKHPERGAAYLPNVSRIDAANAPQSVQGSVNVTVNSNGTKANTTVRNRGGLFQKSTVHQHRQMQPTSDPLLEGTEAE